MKIAICDDIDVILRQVDGIIKMYNRDTGMLYETDTFSDLKAFNKRLEQGGQYDLVFMDIEIGQDNGIAEAERLASVSPATKVVFMTAYGGCMPDIAQECSLGILRKPIVSSQVIKFIDKARYMQEKEQGSFSCSIDGIAHMTSAGEIYYVECRGKRIAVHGENGTEWYTGKADDAERLQEQGKSRFLRIDKSYIINTAYVLSKGSGEISLQAGEKKVTLPVGRAYEEAVNEWYMEHMFEM